MGLLLFVAVFGGIAGFTSVSARDRGRRGWLWALGAVLGGGGGAAVAFVFVSLHHEPDPLLTGVPMMLTVVAMPAGAIVGMVSVLGLLFVLATTTPSLGGRRFLVHRMATRDSAGVDTTLVVSDGTMTFDTTTIDFGDLTAIVADGDCVRIEWQGRSVLLLPAGERRPLERAKHSIGLQNRLRALTHVQRSDTRSVPGSRA